ncbi:MAG: ABC transporter ATP-binding protein [Bacillota bacterium]|nr:ABC transporter ATP-binding protein [Bacillota bacterium]
MNEQQGTQALHMDSLGVRYGSICALHDINLEIDDGDFLGIIGPNGGGKSTLLKAILGLVEPSHGEIKVFDQNPLISRKAIGYVPQAASIDRQFPISVREAVLMGRLSGQRSFFHRYSKQDKEIAHYYMKELEILDLADRQIGQLSGGQFQRVLIARALSVKPRMLLLDEPTASLDAASSSHIYSLLQQLNKELTIILVTHDTLAVSSYVKSIACINHTLYYHGEPNLNNDLVMQLYGCPVDLIAHGVPHRVLGEHGGSNVYSPF